MAHKRVLFRSDAREKVQRGATAIADVLRVTLGPKSRSVLNAVSVAAVLLLTEATMTELPEPKNEPAAAMEGA